MNATLTETDRECGWRDISEGYFGADRLKGLIKQYFNVREDLTDFQRRNDYRGLQLRRADNTKGYVFVGPLQLDRDFERRMVETRQFYSSDNNTILRSFTDFENDLAGFSWRRE